jgi:hypothetical protein
MATTCGSTSHTSRPDPSAVVLCVTQVVVPLHTLIKEHVLAPLASALPPAAPTTTADGLPPLTAQALPQEEELVTLLSDAMVGAGLSWREQLYLCR